MNRMMSGTGKPIREALSSLSRQIVCRYVANVGRNSLFRTPQRLGDMQQNPI